MIKFGYAPVVSRTLDLDSSDFSWRDELIREVPSYKRCIGCGGCTSTCSAHQHTEFSILRCNMLFRRGKYDVLEKELDKCMLCGKCLLVCPRNVNTRDMIIKMRLLVQNKNKKQ